MKIPCMIPYDTMMEAKFVAKLESRHPTKNIRLPARPTARQENFFMSGVQKIPAKEIVFREPRVPRNKVDGRDSPTKLFPAVKTDTVTMTPLAPAPTCSRKSLKRRPKQSRGPVTTIWKQCNGFRLQGNKNPEFRKRKMALLI